MTPEHRLFFIMFFSPNRKVKQVCVNVKSEVHDDYTSEYVFSETQNKTTLIDIHLFCLSFKCIACMCIRS